MRIRWTIVALAVMCGAFATSWPAAAEPSTCGSAYEGNCSLSYEGGPIRWAVSSVERWAVSPFGGDCSWVLVACIGRTEASIGVYIDSPSGQQRVGGCETEGLVVAQCNGAISDPSQWVQVGDMLHCRYEFRYTYIVHVPTELIPGGAARCAVGA